MFVTKQPAQQSTESKERLVKNKERILSERGRAL